MVFRYIGRCDSVRRRGQEAAWQRMMRHARAVSFLEFLRKVDMTPLVDPDENAESYLYDATRADPFTQVYKSKWIDKRCYFLQTAGFEFIFVEST